MDGDKAVLSNHLCIRGMWDIYPVWMAVCRTLHHVAALRNGVVVYLCSPSICSSEFFRHRLEGVASSRVYNLRRKYARSRVLRKRHHAYCCMVLIALLFPQFLPHTGRGCRKASSLGLLFVTITGNGSEVARTHAVSHRRRTSRDPTRELVDCNAP